MATIADNLEEIKQIQEEFKIVGDDKSLIREFQNLTTIIYFEYLSHIVLDNLRHIDLSQFSGVTEYYNYYNTNGLLQELIRINSIGHLSVAWNSYEKYLRKKYQEVSGLTKFKISDVFINLINMLGLMDNNQILEEFDVIRMTRNSLHNGGTYHMNFDTFRGKICGKEYAFLPNKKVTPLRIIDVIRTIWEHYIIIENIKQ